MSDQKRGKSHIRGLIYLPPCRLAATSANKVPRPSRYSLIMATGSKRSSADSDSLLCHVRLRRTSRELTDSRSERGRRRRDRVKFGRMSECEHNEMGFVSAIYCSNTSSVAVNRATFSRWRRLIKPISTDRLHRFSLCHLKSNHLCYMRHLFIFEKISISSAFSSGELTDSRSERGRRRRDRGRRWQPQADG